MYDFSSQTSLSPEPTIDRRALVIPALVPIGVAAAFLIYFSLGVIYFLLGGEPNPHASIGLLFGLVVTKSAIAVLIECVFVPMSIIRLLKYPHLRTPANVWCILFGATFPLLIVAVAAVLHFL